MKVRIPRSIRWFGEAVRGWSRDNVPRLGASLAYYTLLALAPMLLIAMAVAGMLFDQATVRAEIVHQMQNLIGNEGANLVQSMLDALNRESGGPMAVVIGTAAMILAALGAFGELQHALNTIFQVKTKPGLKRKPWRFIVELVKDRLISFGMVLSIGFLLLVSLLVSAALALMASWLRGYLQGADILWQGVNLALSLVVITVLFALIYRFLPDVRIEWRDVWIGAIVTAVLFNVGKAIIGYYLGHSTVASRYGAAGSVVVLLLWVYYSSQVVLLGAEFTRVYVSHQGKEVPPKRFARRDRARHASVPKLSNR